VPKDIKELIKNSGYLEDKSKNIGKIIEKLEENIYQKRDIGLGRIKREILKNLSFKLF